MRTYVVKDRKKFTGLVTLNSTPSPTRRVWVRPLEGSTLLVTHPPCMDCARAICQAGIKEVIAIKPSDEFNRRWSDHIVRTKQLFEECGVLYIEIERCENELNNRS